MAKADQDNTSWERDVANDIQSRVAFLKDKQSYRIRNAIAYARLYGNSSLVGVSGLSSSQQSDYASGRERVSDSIVQGIADTVVAQVGENKPRPYFLTSGGSYKQQRKAKRLNWFTEGIFYENDSYALGGDGQRDAEVFGDGLIFIYAEAGRVKWRRILAAECWIDEAEGGNGRPRELHWEYCEDREVLAAEFPKKRAEIMRADRAKLQEYGGSGTQADMVCVRRSWHLKSGPDAKDGKCCVSITSGNGGGTLLQPLTEWRHDFFPVARFISMSRPWGFWSQGIAERLQSKQIEYNAILAAEQRAMKMVGTFRVFLEEGSKIVKEHVNNQTAALLMYRGTPPIFHTAEPYPAAFERKKQELKEACYESEGISRMSAAGIKPAGLDSGEAQRTYRDTVQLRMKTRERNNEAAYLECAKISIAVASDIAKAEGKYTVEAPNGHSMREVTMTSEDLARDDWTHKCFPTSSLPKDPGGRLATIQEYVQAGFMTPRQARRALDFPDLEAVESLANAAEDLITMVLDAICDDGEEKYAPPEPTFDLALAKEIVVEYINRGMTQELDEDKVDLLRTWSAQVDMLTQAAMPPMPPPGMGAPQAAPAAPPVSQLIPNAPGPAA